MSSWAEIKKLTKNTSPHTDSGRCVSNKGAKGMSNQLPILNNARWHVIVMVCCCLCLTAANAATVNILPVQVCDDLGENCANDSKNLFAAATQKIWNQAGITINYLPWTSIFDSDSLSLGDQAEVDAFLAAGDGAATGAHVLTVWFVDTHFDAWGEVDALGGTKLVVTDDIFGVGRRDTIAHEVGHLLGLKHDDPGMDVTYLMRTGLDRTIPGGLSDINPDGAELSKLTAAQITTAFSSAHVVPLPGAIWMMVSALGLLLIRGRSKIVDA